MKKLILNLKIVLYCLIFTFSFKVHAAFNIVNSDYSKNPLVPSVTISVNPEGAICAGTIVTFTATPTDITGSPTYDFKVNDVSIQNSTSPIFTTSNLINGDIVKVVLTSAPDVLTSNSITMIVNPLPIVTAVSTSPICEGQSATLTANCNLYAINATYSGSQEVPSNSATATGTLTGTFNSLTNQINLNINYNGLSNTVTGSHLHNAPAGSNGGVFLNFGSNGFPTTTSGNFNYSGTYPVAQVANLLNGNVYANIHTSNNPGGEIRGQISATCIANNYTWNPGNQTGQSVSVSPTTTTSYTVTASNSSSGCSSTASVSVVVNPLPSPPSISANPTTVNSGQNTTLTATGCESGIITWSFNSETTNPLVVSVVNTTTFTATCTLNACTSIASNGVTVTVNNPCESLVSLISPDDDYSMGTILKTAASSNGKITATNKITNTAKVTYNAKAIELNTGFKAENGTVFLAQTGGCN